MRKSVLLFVLVALAAVFALSACGNSKNNSNSPAPSSPAASAPAGGAVKEVTITAVNWKFDQPEIKAKVGDTLKLTLVNKSGVHGFTSDELGIKLKNKQTQEVKLDKAGTYEFHCSIQCGQGHDNMTGNIIVE
ncbi:cupredoxin domain-containing protein [Cohnella silvisoli]|uniref:Cupredoxin domain-containing protein n=1 Tax=Cohnella silvisoli TaxID=2873699 RepID=A0ABV1KXH0_9BACL|nr:cupredoxin domain-containing protein [Cohnella silvisoli]MCD9024130.1 cupredoxin domain-containing protein [Cohnella silvisoli]